MTDARIEQVYADRVRAREVLDQAEQFANDAGSPGLSAGASVVLLHNATRTLTSCLGASTPHASDGMRRRTRRCSWLRRAPQRLARRPSSSSSLRAASSTLDRRPARK